VTNRKIVRCASFLGINCR